MLRTLAIAVALLAAGCGGGGCRGPSSTGFERCMDVGPPTARHGATRDIRFAIADRTLTLDVARPIRIAAFRGAGDATGGLASALAALSAHPPDLVLVLGGLGTREASVAAHLRAFSSLSAPTVVLAGGDDVADALTAAFHAADAPAHVIDGRGLRVVRAGSRALALVSGAPLGRYAFTDDACGLAPKDLEDVKASLANAQAPWLVSWAAPSGGGTYGPGRGLAGTDGGDDAIREFARSIGAAGGLYAFPSSRALLPSDAAGGTLIAPGSASPTLSLVVARASGAAVDGVDGALVAPAIAIVELREDGVAYLGTVAPGVRDLPTESGRAAHPDAP